MFNPKRRFINRKVKSRPKLYRMKRSILDWLKLSVGLVFSACLIVGGYAFFIGSDTFKLAEVDLTGGHPHLSQEGILKLAQIPYGQNLFSVNLHEIEASLKRFQWIEEVQIKRRFPNGLHIHVEEYEPIAILVTDDLYYISQNGKIFKKVGTGEGRDYPVITGFSKEQLEGFPGYFRKRINLVFNFLRHFQESTEGEKFGLSEVHYSLSEGITAYTLMPHAEIYFGNGQFDKKMSQWRQFIGLMEEANQFFRSIDLHVEGKVFARI